MSTLFTRFRGEDEEEQIIPNDLCKMSYKTRIIGFVICFILGMIISFLSMLAFPQILKAPHKFAIIFIMGNVVSLASSCFLAGPCSQLKSMFEQTRLIATLVYLGSMIAIILLCIFKPIAGIIFLLIIVCYLAMLWYHLSYIPFARKLVKKTMGKAISHL